MHCPRCQHENPDDARFCGECASSLAEEVVCAACGRKLARVLIETEGAKACSEVEQALARARALVEETGYRLLEPQIHVERAGLARALRQAHCLFTEMGATGHAERIAKELS